MRDDGNGLTGIDEMGGGNFSVLLGWLPQHYPHYYHFVSITVIPTIIVSIMMILSPEV